MGHDSDERSRGRPQRQLGMRRSVLVAAVLLFGSYAGLTAWEKLAVGDPVRLIRSGGINERRKAADDLGVITERTDVDRVMAALVGAVNDDDSDVRYSAAHSLGEVLSAVLGRPARTLAEQQRTEQQVTVATRTFSKSLSDPAASIRELAVWELASLRQRARLDAPPELIAALSDESQTVRQATAKVLKAFHLTASVVPTLIEGARESRPGGPIRCCRTPGTGRA